ncbi:uncharacterized protein EV154DRAFT_538979 [Mucor mucedo]|uniref:uncharacterized protein n=1 Tax=Mucor mucedo TaxID=29922 RepID=UPI0022200A5D|nr:uncharacterized protein EV154DRAFT_538979 [Mucor mucedo]KAI7889239.1 hypothetical protein EV154DRAFT_538979 [Mucor mucedo]
MTTISRKRAICMLYHQDYDKDKANELLNAVEKLDLEICYKDDPCKTFLLYTNSIKADPVSQAQLIIFLDIAFLPVNPNNEEAYACKNLSMNDILTVVWKYSDIFIDKTAYGFGIWCHPRKLFLTESQTKRKYNDLQQKVSIRLLYALEDEYVGKTYSSRS